MKDTARLRGGALTIGAGAFALFQGLAPTALNDELPWMVTLGIHGVSLVSLVAGLILLMRDFRVLSGGTLIARMGVFAYSPGCNEGTTGYMASGVYVVPTSALDDTPEGQPITIGPSFEQTKIGCEGFLGDQDRDIPSNMGAATRFVLDGNLLWLFDDLLLIEATKAR